MTTRFASKEEYRAEGGRGPSAQRLHHIQSTGALTIQRRGGFGGLKSRSTIDQGSLSHSTGRLPSIGQPSDEIRELSSEELKKGHGKLCYVCGAETLVSGSGLRACPTCHSIQLQSGLMSRSYAVAHPDAVLPDGTTSRQASKRSAAEQAKQQAESVDSGTTNILTCKLAWKRLSQASAEMSNTSVGADGFVADPSVAPEERVPIMAGIVNTGYSTGDRVKTTLRLAGAQAGGLGWDPINCETNEGTVVGPGRVAGEIMVKFDNSNQTCSMKMSQIKHVKEKGVQTNVDRGRCRKTLARPSTIM